MGPDPSSDCQSESGSPPYGCFVRRPVIQLLTIRVTAAKVWNAGCDCRIQSDRPTAAKGRHFFSNQGGDFPISEMRKSMKVRTFGESTFDFG